MLPAACLRACPVSRLTSQQRCQSQPVARSARPLSSSWQPCAAGCAATQHCPSSRAPTGDPPDRPGRLLRDRAWRAWPTGGRPAATSCAQLLALKRCSRGMVRLALAGHRLQHSCAQSVHALLRRADLQSPHCCADCGAALACMAACLQAAGSQPLALRHCTSPGSRSGAPAGQLVVAADVQLLQLWEAARCVPLCAQRRLRPPGSPATILPPGRALYAEVALTACSVWRTDTAAPGGTPPLMPVALRRREARGEDANAAANVPVTCGLPDTSSPCRASSDSSRSTSSEPARSGEPVRLAESLSPCHVEEWLLPTGVKPARHTGRSRRLR